MSEEVVSPEVVKKEDAPCCYPKCKNASFSAFDMKIQGRHTERVRLPFCKYHCIIMMSDEFMAQVDDKILADKTRNLVYDDFKIYGPMLTVSVTERVVAAIETLKKDKGAEQHEVGKQDSVVSD
jgi:hypothetical protein